MDWYRIYADDLDEEELDYELAIRACPLVGGPETRRRELRNLLRDPNSSNTLVIVDHMMQADLDIVPYKHQRIRRYVPHDAAELENRRRLLETVTDLARRYFHLDFRLMDTPVPQDEVMGRATVNSPRFTSQATSATRPGEDVQAIVGPMVNPVRSNSAESSNVAGAVGGEVGIVSDNRQFALNNPEPAVINPDPDHSAFPLWRPTAAQQPYTGAIPRAARPSIPECVQSPPQIISSLNFNLQNPQQGTRCSIPCSAPIQETIGNQPPFVRRQQGDERRPIGVQLPQRADEVRPSSRMLVESLRVSSGP